MVKRPTSHPEELPFVFQLVVRQKKYLQIHPIWPFYPWVPLTREVNICKETSSRPGHGSGGFNLLRDSKCRVQREEEISRNICPGRVESQLQGKLHPFDHLRCINFTERKCIWARDKESEGRTITDGTHHPQDMDISMKESPVGAEQATPKTPKTLMWGAKGRSRRKNLPSKCALSNVIYDRECHL